jgi:hypothetical protein
MSSVNHINFNIQFFKTIAMPNIIIGGAAGEDSLGSD